MVNEWMTQFKANTYYKLNKNWKKKSDGSCPVKVSFKAWADQLGKRDTLMGVYNNVIIIKINITLQIPLILSQFSFFVYLPGTITIVTFSCIFWMNLVILLCNE